MAQYEGKALQQNIHRLIFVWYYLLLFMRHWKGVFVLYFKDPTLASISEHGVSWWFSGTSYYTSQTCYGRGWAGVIGC